MRLRQLDAQFVGEYSDAGGRRSYRRLPTIGGAQGLLFQCPVCAAGKPVAEDGEGVQGAHYVLVWFENPRHALPVPPTAAPGPARWKMEGSSIEDVTLHPSVLLTGPGCGWHGWVKAGDAT